MTDDLDRETRRKKEIFERVWDAFGSIGVTTQTEIERRLGVDQSTVSKWRKGQYAPSNKNMLDIAEMTGYEFNWLWKGQGLKITPPDDPESDKINRVLQSVDDDTRKRIREMVELLLRQQTPPE